MVGYKDHILTFAKKITPPPPTPQPPPHTHMPLQLMADTLKYGYDRQFINTELLVETLIHLFKLKILPFPIILMDPHFIKGKLYHFKYFMTSKSKLIELFYSKYYERLML